MARAGVATNTAAIALKADQSDLQAAVRELGSSIGDNSDAIADISENEVRVLAVSGWDAGDTARAIHLAIYPPEAIGRNTTLRFTIGGVAISGNSGDGIDANGSDVAVAVNAANSATITRSAARDGYVPVDWIYQGNTYHAFMDYVPAGPPVPKSSILLTASDLFVDNFTLPANYATYKWLTGVWEGNIGSTNRAQVPFTIPTSLLSAQNNTFAVASNQDGTTGGIAWNRTTRIMDARRAAVFSGGEGAGTFAYLELHD